MHEDEKPAEFSSSDSLVEKLKVATEGLLYISETDAPLTSFFWPVEDESLSPELVKRRAQLPADAEVSTQALGEFFEPVTTEEEWMNDEEKAEVQRFQNLQKTLEENLNDITVFRFGQTEMDVFIVGKTDDAFVGIRTKVVET